MKRIRYATTLLLLALLAPAAGLTAQGGPARPKLPAADPSGLLFIENAGQFDRAARFQVWGGGQTLWLAEDALWLTIIERSHADTLTRFDPQRVNVERENVQRVNVKVSFPGANLQPILEPFDRLDTHVSYFIGADSQKWRADVPVSGGVRYRELYPGLDLEITGMGGQWQWRLVRDEQSAVNEQRVTLRVEGADGVAVAEDGLRLSTAVGDLTLPLLTTEQPNVERASVERVNAEAFDVAAPFARSHTQTIRFATTRHAAANPQSSGLSYATFLGGNYGDFGTDIVVDSTGRAYVTGSTGSADFPASLGPGYDTSHNGDDDAFVIKLDPAGTGLLYATFFGGSQADWSSAIAIDNAGQAYVTGQTNSADFPASLGPGYDTSFNGIADAFVVKLNAAGTSLHYATFLGGSDGEDGSDIAVDSAGQAYVAGTTLSINFPASRGPGYDTSHNGWNDAFVVKLDAAGTGLRYATFLGGSDVDDGFGITVDGVGHAHITGYTYSANFPASHGPGYDTTYNGKCDAFVAKLDTAGTGLVYATFLGGGETDEGSDIALDSAGQAYVTGNTRSADFPAGIGPSYDTSFNGGIDAFVARLSATGTGLSYATFLGGSGYDLGLGIAVDGSGQAYATGSTYSADFPASYGPGYDTSHNGRNDAFVVKLDAAGTGLRYATFLGGTALDQFPGSGYEDGQGIAVNGAGQAYVTGSTSSTDFPASLGPGYDTSYNGGAIDGFAIKVDTAISVPPTATPTATSTPTATMTPTPTGTPTSPWASWASGERPLPVPPAGVAAIVDYGNMTPPVPVNAQVAGAALFDTGTGGGTTAISTVLPDGSGAYVMKLIPASGATPGQVLNIQVDIGSVTLTKDGWIARQVWLPLILR